MEPVRTCTKCGVEKRLEEFAFADKRRGWRRHECKACQNTRVERWRSVNRGRDKKRQANYFQNLKRDPERYRRWLERKKRYQAKSNARYRDEAYEAYGGPFCACCGEDEPMFLTIDHVENDGKEGRKQHGLGAHFYRWLKKNGYPPGLQVLCYNCNLGKHRNGGTCPHREGSETIRKE